MRKGIINLLALVLGMSFCAFTGATGDDSASPTEKERDGWPKGSATQAIPIYMGGTLLHVTETAVSSFILIGDVSKDEAKAYWDEAQQDGFTHIVTKSENAFYDGFTYVATNEQGISLSLTWSPGIPATMTILAIVL